MSYIAKAIRSLKETAEFSYEGDDYSTINWIVLEGDAPTQKQIDDEIKRIKEVEAAETQSKATAKAALLKKLGITEAEAELLLA